MGDITYHKSNKKEIRDPVIRKFKNRIYSQDNDVFLIIAGPRGSTKSGSGISIGYQTDTDMHGNTRFYLDKKYVPQKFLNTMLPGERLPRILYNPSQLMDMLKHNNDYPMGTCILWDEAGVEGDSRDFATKKNKILKRTFQTIRSLNWFIMLTAVTIKDFDVGLERNAGFYMQTFGKTKLPRDGKMYPYGVTKFYEMTTNPRTGDRITPYLKTPGPMGLHRKLSEPYYVRKPPSWMENPYKRYKKWFQDNLYGQYAAELDNADDYYVDTETKVAVDLVSDKIKEILNNPADYFNFKSKRFVKAAIQHNGEIKIDKDKKATEIMQLLTLKLANGEINFDKR